MKIRLPESELEYTRTLHDAAEIGSVQTLVSTGTLPPFMSLTEAQKTYGKGNVNFWHKSGLIELVKDGGKNAKIRIDRVQILSVAKTQNRAEWFVNKSKNKEQAQ
jgi:hypothetical protein